MSASVLHVLRRRVASSLMPVRGGGGAPYPGSDYKAASSALPESLDMTWDDGTRNIEPVMDIYASEHISLAGASAWFAGGLSVFYGVWKFVEMYDKPSEQPFAPREYPDLEPLANVQGVDSE
eukprot:jgi/Ulvmu1/6383/UM003_0011.1